MSDNGKKAQTAKPRDYRCHTCGKLLCRAILPEGARVEIRCPRCTFISIFLSDVETYKKKLSCCGGIGEHEDTCVNGVA